MWPLDRNIDPFYEQVYRWFPDRTYDRVLIVGAGSGTDVAVALKHGAGHIDAVEIDPRIQEIGVRDHPNRPYDDPRVSRIIDDGRAFLRRTTEKYDLVVFALPDSLTLVSTSANLRLESFLFTSEAFDDVRDHLTDDGIFVMYNYYREDWLPQKMAAMLEKSFGSPPMARLYGNNVAATLAAGPAVQRPRRRQAAGRGCRPDRSRRRAPAPATDDWPFLYLRERFVAPYYLGALAIIIAFAVLLVGRAAAAQRHLAATVQPALLRPGHRLPAARDQEPRDLQPAVRDDLDRECPGLLRGARQRPGGDRRQPARPIPQPGPACTSGLFGTIGLAVLLPPASLLIEPIWLRYVLASALAFAPIFFANLVFSYSFRDTKTADMAFASNLLGAVVGGAIEYVALVTGYGWLLVVVAALYATAWLLATRLQLLADRDLARGRRLALPAEVQVAQ